MFHTPAHKQTDPAKLPAQTVSNLTPTERSVGLMGSHLFAVETACGTPLNVSCDSRTQAAGKARRLGFSVCSVNMIG